jgi:hypothetical protein
VSAPGGAPAGAVRRIAAATWAFRHDVEREAAARFERLAGRLEALAAPQMAELVRSASRDESRHALLCAGLAEDYGATLDASGPPRLADIAPRQLAERERVLYEVVAACCIAETESMGTLTALLGAAPAARVRDVLRELAADEVRHARLGWAHLASESARIDSSFLGRLVPAMLAGNAAPDLFLTGSPESEDPGLLEHGVLPHGAKREVFVHSLEQVVFPGLEQFGIDTAPARAWLRVAQGGGA